MGVAGWRWLVGVVMLGTTRAAVGADARGVTGHGGGRAPVVADSAAAIIATLVGGAAPDGVRHATWSDAAAIYAARSYRPLWLGGPQDLDWSRVSALVEAVVRSTDQGLRPAEYPLAGLSEALEAVRSTTAPAMATLARADVMLTSTLAAFASDLLTGRLAPSAVEPGWHIDPTTPNVDSAVVATLAAPDLAVALGHLEPRNDGYRTLTRALARYRAIAAHGGWPVMGEGATLRPGDSSASVPRLRHRLAVEGVLATDDLRDTPRVFGAELASAVAQFQERHGLTVDSVVGPRTRAALDVSASRRARQIVANLERMRWLPPHLGDRYVFVNVPAFRLDAYDGGAPVLHMRVIVGADYDVRATPIFSDSMRYVVFDPYWNVPASIAIREILPEARRDRRYLAEHRYEIVSGWGTGAQRVHPGVLRDADFRSYRFRIRQRPGPGNALGLVKFMFPNDYNVYLHDTPERHLFAETTRAFSHGCVRVENPEALAAFVLGPQGWTIAEIEAAMMRGERREVDLERPVPVYIAYLTAFARDGQVSFRADLYGRDEPVIAALAAEDMGLPPAAARLLRAAGVTITSESIPRGSRWRAEER